MARSMFVICAGGTIIHFIISVILVFSWSVEHWSIISSRAVWGRIVSTGINSALDQQSLYNWSKHFILAALNHLKSSKILKHRSPLMPVLPMGDPRGELTQLKLAAAPKSVLEKRTWEIDSRLRSYVKRRLTWYLRFIVSRSKVSLDKGFC